jgi:starvation-inducible DNA-binding protein
MSQALKSVPKADKIDTGVAATTDIAEVLVAALADTQVLLFKTQAYHWNVEGPLFHPIHVLTEAQYTDLFAAADVIAERIRALGRLAPFQLAELAEKACIRDRKALPSAQGMVEDLATDHETIAKRLHGAIETAESGGDPVTADLLTSRAGVHEKAAWMLRATAK